MKTLNIDNYYKYDKHIFSEDLRTMADDIEFNDGENVYDIMEDYYE